MSRLAILQNKSVTNLKIFLEDLGYYEWKYKHKPVLVFDKYFDYEGNENNPLNEKGTLENVFKRTRKDLLSNLFIQINGGRKICKEARYKHKTEGRKKSDIIFYNAFMLDFDLKDKENKHYKGQELRKRKAELLKAIWYKLPLKPDYMVESRNGFHVYYLIHQEERKMSSERWHCIEIGIFDYVKEKISDNVDHAVKKSNQIMRLPYSFHIKDDDNDEGFQVKIIYERDKKLKNRFIEHDFYESAMFAYSTKDLISKFDIGKNFEEKITGNKKTPAVREQEQIKPSNEWHVTKYPAIEAIQNEDTTYFDYLQRNTPKAPMTRQVATEYIKNFNIRTVLKVKAELKKAFSSLFYEDTYPSDYFFKNKFGRTVYYCRKDDYFYNDIFNIVYRVLKFKTEITEKEKWRKTFEFVYKMFGIKIVSGVAGNTVAFENARAINLKILKVVSEHSKKTKYLKKFIFKLYETIMDLWKEHSDKYNLAWRELHRTLSVNYLAEKLGKKRGDSQISKGLIILEALGLIEKVESNFKINENLPSANEYKFPILTQENINIIISRAEQIKHIFKNPLRTVTREKMITVSFTKKKSDVNNYT